MKEYSVIIPVHEYNETVENLLRRAIDSVPEDMTMVIVCGTKEIATSLLPFSQPCRNCIISSRGDSFSVLVNEGIDYVKRTFQDIKYAYLLEYDDEFNSIWFDEVKKEVNDKPEVSVFMPLTEIIDFESNKFLSYGNEAPWASSFSNEIGYIDNESLQQFFDFYLTGSVFNLRDWTYVGGLKESIKLSFWYEFLLRLTHNEKKAYVIPKLGYKHYVNRPNSLYDQYRETMTEEESQWWYNLALEEYTYKKDRKKEYNN